MYDLGPKEKLEDLYSGLERRVDEKNSSRGNCRGSCFSL